MQLGLALFDEPEPRPLGKTFRDSRGLPVHRWYSYVEGFSAEYLMTMLDDFASTASSLYDPFGGAGTALVEAAQRGLPTFYAEANPFMGFVIDAKINAGGWARRNPNEASSALGEFRERILHPSFRARAERVEINAYAAAFPNRDFFEEHHVRELLAALELARCIDDRGGPIAQLALLACAANVVDSSNMTRRADLRRRRPGEYKNRIVDVPVQIATSVEWIVSDVLSLSTEWVETRQIGSDCRAVDTSWNESFDLALTSPPYLNGTNYIRNTKLELFFLGYIQSEFELGMLREAGVTAGITQAATSRPIEYRFDEVEEVATKLDVRARDPRIPHLVRAYCSDMYEVLRAVHRLLAPGGAFVLDIGDSQFYGVHVPTDRLIARLSERAGFRVEHDRIIARRHSRDKTPLVQVDLHLRK